MSPLLFRRNIAVFLFLTLTLLVCFSSGSMKEMDEGEIRPSVICGETRTSWSGMWIKGTPSSLVGVAVPVFHLSLAAPACQPLSTGTGYNRLQNNSRKSE